MHQVPADNPPIRFPQLDAIRGLAALVVFIGHAVGMLPQVPPFFQAIRHTPLHFFYDGEAAVILFFVLSGFVLNLKYTTAESRSQRWVIPFIIRRIFRIYPAFVVGVLFSLFLKSYVFAPSSMAPFSEWFNQFWQAPVTLQDVLHTLTLVAPGINANLIDPPIWSLIVEMRLSLLFPLIIWMVNPHQSIKFDFGILILTYLLCFLARSSLGLFGPHFVLGAFCAKYIRTFSPVLARLSIPLKALWILTSLLLFESVTWSQSHDPDQWSIYFLMKHLNGFGAAGIILAGLSFQQLSQILKGAVFQFLGKTSYSFYILHMVLLLAIGTRIYQLTDSFLVAWMLTLIVSYAAAYLVYISVELPMIKVGFLISSRFKTCRTNSISN